MSVWVFDLVQGQPGSGEAAFDEVGWWYWFFLAHLLFGGALVYWRPGCPYCAMLRLGLRGARVPATWVNIWEDRAAAARSSSF